MAPGNLVTADTTVLTNIVNLDPIRFAFTGSEALYLKYQRENAAGTRASSRAAANPVEIRLQDEPTYRWKGRMEFVDNALDPARAPSAAAPWWPIPTSFLTPGMFGHMRLLGSGSYPALLIPDQAVVTDQERQVVYVRRRANNVAQCPTVELGPLSRGLRVVRTGLKAGDLVVIDGVQRAQAGHEVDPRRGRIEASAAGRERSDDRHRAARLVGRTRRRRSIAARPDADFALLHRAAGVRRGAGDPDHPGRGDRLPEPAGRAISRHRAADGQRVGNLLRAPRPRCWPTPSPRPIEEQINGVENMLYMSSQSTGDGHVTITVTFKLGTDPNAGAGAGGEPGVLGHARCCRRRWWRPASPCARPRPIS